MHEDFLELNILGVAIDGLNIFQLSDVYQMNMYVVLASQPGMYFSQVNTKHTRTEKYNSVTEWEAYSLNFLRKEVPSPVKAPIHFFRPSASDVNNSNDHHQI